jgi:hypothetical protein
LGVSKEPVKVAAELFVAMIDTAKVIVILESSVLTGKFQYHDG